MGQQWIATLIGRIKPSKSAALLFLLLLFGYLLYSPGISGPFLFDDNPNLSQIGALGPINSLDLFWVYLSNGFAGPTGRPLALATFLLDSRDWPADPESFKQTNIFIHLLIGLVLFFATQKLLRLSNYDAPSARAIALLATAFWILNPFFVSTTLYVVQRMAQLSALFVILGIWGYLLGRESLQEKPKLGYPIITASIIFFTALATLSKENGILLPALVLTIEFSLGRRWNSIGPSRVWSALFLWFPSALIFAYLSLQLTGGDDLPTRDYTLTERVLSQPRFLWDYVYHLLIPRLQTQGLFQDGRIVSRSLFEPLSTIVSFAALLGAFILSIAFRRKAPFLTLAVLFFLVGHSVESSTVNLELYFEHRNYLPGLFFFLPLALMLCKLHRYMRPKVWVFLAIISLAPYAFATYQRASLWGDEQALLLVWAEQNPSSARAQVAAAEAFFQLGDVRSARERIRDARLRLPEDGLLRMAEVLIDIEQNAIEAAEFRTRLEEALEGTFDAQLARGLEQIAYALIRYGREPEFFYVMISILDRRDFGGSRWAVIGPKFAPFLQGQLLSRLGYGGAAYKKFVTSLDHYNTTEAGLKMVTILAGDDHLELAGNLLDRVGHVLENEPDSSLRRSRRAYELEIHRLEMLLNQKTKEPRATHFP